MTDLMFDRLATIDSIVRGTWGQEAEPEKEIPTGEVGIEVKDPAVYDDEAELPIGGGTYSGAVAVSGKALPGTIALQEFLLAKFGGTNGGLYVNRDVRGRPGVLSMHATGRAGDTMVDPATGDAIAQYLVAQADRLGIQQVIWNRRSWNSRTRTWKAYSGVNPHTDHVHWELTEQAAGGTSRGRGATQTAMSAAPADDLLGRLSQIDAILKGRPVQGAKDPSGMSAPTLRPAQDGSLPIDDIYRTARNAGFTRDEAITMAAIAMAESGGRPNAHNPVGRDDSYGLWQINMLGQMGADRRKSFGITSNEELWDPSVNARAARAVFGSQGFRAWSVFTSGKYRSFLAAAQAAAARLG